MFLDQGSGAMLQGSGGRAMPDGEQIWTLRGQEGRDNNNNSSHPDEARTTCVARWSSSCVLTKGI